MGKEVASFSSGSIAEYAKSDFPGILSLLLLISGAHPILLSIHNQQSFGVSQN
jgi:hypothetical protein